MHLHCVLLLSAALATTAATQRTSRWWFGSSPTYLQQALQIVDGHRAALTGCYFYYGFSVSGNGTFVSPPPQDVASSLLSFVARSLTVSVALGLNQSAVESGAALKAVDAAAAAADAANLTSLMIDYEPASNYTHEHAEAYAAFVSSLASALHARGRTLDICVSSWNILTEFGLYAKNGVDGMMSMASTYFGTNVSSNEEWVRKELADGVSLAQLRVGIGSTNAIFSKWDYNWTESRLTAFVGWLEAQGVLHIDLWRTDIDGVNATNGTAAWDYEHVHVAAAGRRATPPLWWKQELANPAYGRNVSRACVGREEFVPRVGVVRRAE